MTIETNFLGVLINFLSGLGAVGAAALVFLYLGYAAKALVTVYKTSLDGGNVWGTHRWLVFRVLMVGFLLTVTISAASTYRPRVATEQTFGNAHRPPVERPDTGEYAESTPEHESLAQEQKQQGATNPDQTFKRFQQENQ